MKETQNNNTQTSETINLNSYMARNLESLIITMDRQRRLHPERWERIKAGAPEEFWDSLRSVSLPELMMEEYKNSRNNLTQLADYRTFAQMKFNHFIGYAFECIAAAILVEQGFQVIRVGCDSDIMNPNVYITSIPDFIIQRDGHRIRLDVQKAPFLKFRSVLTKCTKVHNLLAGGSFCLYAIDVDDQGRIYTKSIGFQSVQDAREKSAGIERTELKPRYKIYIDEPTLHD